MNTCMSLCGSKQKTERVCELNMLHESQIITVKLLIFKEPDTIAKYWNQQDHPYEDIMSYDYTYKVWLYQRTVCS